MKNRKVLKRASFLFVCVAMFLSIFQSQVFAQDVDSLTIVGLLTSDDNPDIVGVMLEGPFEIDDVVNIYTNDVFIKSSVITEDNLRELPIRNISLDVFPEGENTLIAKIERNGFEELESEPYVFEVRDRVERKEEVSPPAVDIEDKVGEIKVRFSGEFQEGDVIHLYSNDEFINSIYVTAEDIEYGRGIDIERAITKKELEPGEHIFVAQLDRGGVMSEFGQISLSITVKEDEGKTSIVSEVVTTPPTQEISNPTPPLIEKNVCYNYDTRLTINNTSVRGNDVFGNTLGVADMLVVTSGKGNTIYTQNIHNNQSATLLLNKSNDSLKSGVKIATDNEGLFALGVSTSNEVGFETGRVDIYRSIAGSIHYVQTILPSTVEDFSRFGSNVAVGDNYLVVQGYSDGKGVVYLYQRIGDSFQYISQLTPFDATATDDFGFSLATSGNMIAVGDPNAFFGTVQSGIVQLYTGQQTSDGHTFAQVVISDSEGRADTYFGHSLAISGASLFVTALNGHKSIRNSGVVYEYVVYDGNPSLVSTHMGTQSHIGDEFGFSIATNGDVLVIGAPGDSTYHNDAGAVYVYRNRYGMWVNDTVFRSDVSRGNTGFGSSVSVSENRIAVGSPSVDLVGAYQGIVYVYTPVEIICPEDTQFFSDPQPIVTEKSEDQIELEHEILSILEQYNLVLSEQITLAQEERDRELQENRIYTVHYETKFGSADIQERAAQSRGRVGPSVPRQPVVTAVFEDQVEIEEEPDETQLPPEVVRATTESEFGTVVPLTGNQELKLGDTGNEVLRLQIFLNENGFIIAFDGEGSTGFETGVFDKNTENALKRFQSINGIPVTGVLDSATRSLILRFIPANQ